MRRAGILVLLSLLLLVAAPGCALPGGHPSANSLRKAAIEWIEAEPRRGSVTGSATDSWSVGDSGGLIQWRSTGPWDWTYDQDERAFYVFDPREEGTSLILITKDWLETEGAYEQVAQIVDALAESLATCPYAVLRAGEVINPLVFESEDKRAWYCSAQAPLAEVLQPYFPEEVVETLSADKPDSDVSVSYLVLKEGRALQTTQVRQGSSPSTPQIICTWDRLGPPGASEN